MSRRITQKELRNETATVLGAAEQGEEIIITRNGTPIARLMPLVDESPFVSTDQLKHSAQGLPRVDFQRFREDLAEHVDWEWRDPYERRND
jgi:prevent-host-death family protein